MELERIRQIVEAYGALSDRWPDDERDAAWALLARSEDAVWLVEQAQELDLVMDQAAAEAPSDALVERILQSAAIHASSPKAVPGDEAAMGGFLMRWKNGTVRWVTAVRSDVDGIEWTMRSLARPASARSSGPIGGAKGTEKTSGFSTQLKNKHPPAEGEVILPPHARW